MARTGYSKGAAWARGIVLWALFAAGVDAGLRLESSDTPMAIETIATGLSAPGGMAVHPETGDLFVAERTAERISVIRNRKAVPILSGPLTISTNLPLWVLAGGQETITNAYLHKPIDVAFDSKGHLYVAESAEYGRLLEFTGINSNKVSARVVITPWFNMTYGYTSIAVATNDRLFTTAQHASSRTITMGSVLTRSPEGLWQLVDFGPFAEFVNVAINADGSWLAVGERRRGDVSWYDVDREIEISSADHLEGIRHLALQPDGTALASLARQDGTWSLMVLDPVAGTMRELAGGLNDIGGICVNPRTSDIYISLSWKGEIMRLHRLQPYDDFNEDEMLHRIERKFEFEQILPPKEWPAFFKKFVEKLDVIETINPKMTKLPSLGGSLARNAEGTGSGSGKGRDGYGRGSQIHLGTMGYAGKEPMTMNEFAAAVPVVAGKVKTRLLSDPKLEPDPIEEVSFVLLYPNQTMVTRQSAAPSVSLIRVQHTSGHVSKTRFMPNRDGNALRDDMDEGDLPDVLVSFPSGFITPKSKQASEGLVSVYFCGMGLGSDYWIDINRLFPETSRMVVEKNNGDRIQYSVEPYEEDQRAGGQSVLVGMGTPPPGGWYTFNEYPALWSVSDAEQVSLKTKHWVGVLSAPAQNIRDRASFGEVYTGELTQEEINLRRKIVLRAATRWE
ncbi:MAG: hypothetical protein EOM20_11665 [Spartobacteria bacterium]|nr:hypothetical protein [Spartobacteria bacterium]